MIERDAGVVRGGADEVREVGMGRGTRGPATVVEEGTTRLPGTANAPPSLVSSVGVERPGVPTLG